MLRLMRDYATSWLIKIVLGAIVIVFVFWGVGSFKSQRGSMVASVNGEVISIEEYRDSYNNLLEQYRRQFGNNLNDEIIKMLNLKQQAVDRLINKRILLQEARNLELRVTKEELTDYIRQVPAFMSQDKFDIRRYRRVLSQNRLTPEGFEAGQKDVILIEKLRGFVLNSAKVSDPEIRQWYDFNNREVSIEYALFKQDRYPNIDPSKNEIEAYFSEHKENYKTEPMIKLDYLYFNPDLYNSQVKISDDDIRDYYESNPTEFKTEKTIEARHILFKLDEKADQATAKATREKALEVVAKAEAGQDFAELAKKYSEGPSNKSGGFLGAFPKKAMVKPFADKAFSMKAGEISKLVKTRFGLHIIKVEKINPATTATLEESSARIRQNLTDAQAKNIAYDKAEAAYDLSYDGDSLDNTASAINMQLISTDFFSRQGPAKGVKDRRKFAAAAFALPLMDISEVQELSDGYYLLQVTSKVEAKVPTLESVLTRIKKDFVKKQQLESAEKEAQTLLKALQDGKAIDTETQKMKITTAISGFFKRNQAIPEIGSEPELSAAAFSLSKKDNLPKQVFKTSKGYYVIKLKENKLADEAGFEKEKKKIWQTLLQQKQQVAFNAFITQARNKSEIKIEQEFLNNS